MEDLEIRAPPVRQDKTGLRVPMVTPVSRAVLGRWVMWAPTDLPVHKDHRAVSDFQVVSEIQGMLDFRAAQERLAHQDHKVHPVALEAPVPLDQLEILDRLGHRE